MNNMESVANNILPIMTKFLITIGVVICLLSIIVAIYAYVKRKTDKKTIITYSTLSLFSGILISVSGLIVNFMANFKIDFSTYKVEIPMYLILALIIFSLIMNHKNNASN